MLLSPVFTRIDIKSAEPLSPLKMQASINIEARGVFRGSQKLRSPQFKKVLILRKLSKIRLS